MKLESIAQCSLSSGKAAFDICFPRFVQVLKISHTKALKMNLLLVFIRKNFNCVALGHLLCAEHLKASFRFELKTFVKLIN